MNFSKATWTFLTASVFPRVTSLSARRWMIAAVSVFDAILLFVFADGIVFQEENPLGLALIRASEGDVTRFAMVKLTCTALVFIVLRILERRDFLAASVVTNALLAFQTWLIWYLCFSTYWTTDLDKVMVAVLCFGAFMVPLLWMPAHAREGRRPLFTLSRS